MSKQNKLFNNIIGISIALATPYCYYFMVRPKLLEYEQGLDTRMTAIKDDDFEKMKKKYETMKKTLE
jgi:hypothetical protein